MQICKMHSASFLNCNECSIRKGFTKAGGRAIGVGEIGYLARLLTTIAWL